MSLIKLAKKDRLPEHQYMDEDTLNWANRNGQHFLNCDTELDPDIFSKLEKIDGYVPSLEWFTNKEVVSGIHGLRHIMRVCVNLKLLFSEMKKGNDTLLIAAALHDIKRVRDREDSSHGFKAADWFSKNTQEIEDYYKTKFSKKEKCKIYNAIRFHASDYEEFASSEEYEKYGNIIDLLKTADSLDRFRLPKLKWWIDDDYLKIKPSQKIINFSFKCFFYSEKFALSGLEDIASIKKAIKFIKNGE